MTLARSFAAVLLLFAAGLALAQDRSMTVREVDIAPKRAEIEVLPDGGCMLTAFAAVSPPSVEPYYVRTQYPFNGARCTTTKNAIVAAAKKDLQVGNGADP